MNRIHLFACLLAAFSRLAMANETTGPLRPNVLWFVVDDMSPNFSCYGESLITTPNADRLAREGTKFTNAFVTAPVCSPCRSALITGRYQTSIGAHHHRSGRGRLKIELPADAPLAPALFQQAGYYTCIGDGLAASTDTAQGRSAQELGKTDYNFQWDRSVYDGADWAGRAPEQPFFMQVQLPGGKLRGNTEQSAAQLSARARRQLGSSVPPNEVQLPPYYPRHPILLADWAAYLDAVRFTDRHVGQVLARLERENLLDRTLIVFLTDHGVSHARGKQFLYDEGTHIPLIVRGPGVPSNFVRDDLVEHIDVAALSLAAAGIALPAGMHGRNILAPDYFRRDAVFAARDRCDETVDRIRSIRTGEFLYIRNFYPQRPLLQPNAYKDGKSIIQTLRALHASNQLPDLAERLLFAPERPAEELYRWRTDPWQLHNLAGDPTYRDVLHDLRDRLDQWIAKYDQGPEFPAMYDSDMAEYVGSGDPVIERNIALMKRWAAEGK